MIQRKLQNLRIMLLLGDALMTSLVFTLAFQVRFTFLPAPLGVPGFAPYGILLAAVLVSLWLAFALNGLYRLEGSFSRIEEIFKTLLGVLGALIMTSAALQFYRGFSYSRLFLILFFFTLFPVLASWRFGFKAALRRMHRRGRFCERILIVGAGTLGRTLADLLRTQKEIGLTLVGFLDDDPGKAGAVIDGIPVLGPAQDAETLLRRHDIDAIYIAIPMGNRPGLERLVRILQSTYVEVYFVPDVMELLSLRATVEDLHGMPVVHLSASPLAGWGAFAKRGMDLLLAGLGIAAFAPFWAVIAFLIKREDGGPVFYRQDRMGLDGRSFRMWKFRSMGLDAEKDGNPVMAVRDDPRRTRIGEFLRSWSLDETPQFLNVLKGDMSLVGPRPERPEFVQEFAERLPRYVLRHRVRSGITGWAQVNGLRGQSSIRRRLEYDLYYIQNWSLKFDLKILLLTLVKGFRHRNAY